MQRIRCLSALGVLVAMLLNGCTSEPPVAVVFRHSSWGESKGAVAIITNTSDAHLHSCELKIETTTGKTWGPKVFATTLAPHAAVEVGWMELEDVLMNGNDLITIACGDSGDLRVRVPTGS